MFSFRSLFPNRSIQGLALIASVLIVSLGLIFIAKAWTEPSQAPPGGNVPAPLNISGTTQTKSGGLNVATQSGQLGVGTTNPGETFDLVGNSEFNGLINLNQSKNFGGDYSTDNANYSNSLFIGGKSQETLQVFKQNSGGASTFCGSSHWHDCYVFMMTDSNSVTEGPAGILFGKTGNNDNFEDIMIIKQNGRVGIGNTNPAQLLDVSGQIHATGDICTDQGGGICLTSAGQDGYLPDDPATSNVDMNSHRIQDLGAADSNDDAARWGQIKSWAQRDIGGDCGSGRYVYGVRNNGSLKCRTDQTDGGGCSDVFDSVGTDSGTAYAGGCSDRLYIRGGTNVNTSASGDTITISASDGGGMPGAGRGLYYSGDTLHVGEGSGIDVTSNDVRIKYPDYSCPTGTYLREIDLRNHLKVCERDDTGGGSLSCITRRYYIGGWANETHSCSSGRERTGCFCGHKNMRIWSRSNGCKFGNPTMDGANCYMVCCKIQ